MSKTYIHPTAVVSDKASLGIGVLVGPYAVIESDTEIGDRCHIGSHCVIHSFVRMGKDNDVCSHTVIGGLPQDISFKPDTETWVEIGNNNTLREGVTINRATSPKRATQLGSGCYLMAHTHIGHDCVVADDVILTINSCVGGHVEIGNRTVIGGGVMIHQFCRIGSGVMIAGLVAVRKDVMPYTMLAGEPLRHIKLNTVGLRRAGVRGDRYKVLEHAFRELRKGNRSLDHIESIEEVMHLREWFQCPSKRGLYGFS